MSLPLASDPQCNADSDRVISPNNNKSGLNKVVFGNVANDDLVRHVGHFLVAFILILWTLFLIFREYKHFVEVRQAWLASPQHLELARTRTVVVSNMPKDIDSPSAVRELGGVVSQLTGNFGPRASNVTDGTYVGNEGAASPSLESEGGVRQVWLTKKVKPVEKIFDERNKECVRLEGGASKLAATANKNQLKGKTPEAKGKYDTERSASNLADRYVLPKKQPKWKIGLLGLFGEKHNLESSPVYIKEHNEELEKLRADQASLDNGNTAFLRFGSQTEAHAFARLIDKSDKRFKMVRTSVEVVPEDVQWSNISMSPYERHIRTAISWALTIGLIIIWAIPVAFVGIVSNIDAMCEQASWLAWLCTIPDAALGIIKGILPSVLLVVLFALLPVVIRKWIQMQGEILKSDIELKLFSRFWLFQVIHGFLIVTLASGLITALQNIDEQVKELPTLLANKLPDASIFFLTFVLTTTFAAAAKAYSRAIPSAMSLLSNFPIIRGNTPRKVYAKKFKMMSFSWATAWPPICLLICLTIVYSVIQPIMVVISLFAFIIMYAAHKYLMYWCADQPDALETGGLLYIKALRTVFVSLYIEEICLCGLFFLMTDDTGSRSTTGLACGAIMAALIVFTALFQIWIDWFRFKKDYLYFAHSSGAAGGKSSTFKDKVGMVTTEPVVEEMVAGPEFGNTSGYHSRAFDHPALWKAQPTIWLAEDPLGISRYESARIADAGVPSSTEYAAMNEKGIIDVSRSAPDEAWYNGVTSE